MTDFTPGPWKCSGPDDFGDFTIQHDGEALAIAAVCNGDFKAYAGRSDEHQANAHLIAASPELYEALEACLNELLNVYHSEFDGVWAASDFERVESEYLPTLKKARGQ